MNKAIYLKYLMKKGFKKGRAVKYIKSIYSSMHAVKDVSWIQKKWLFRHGFYADKMNKYGLTKENYKKYLSDYDYFKYYPYNNHFEIWINDKLTLKYIMEKYSEFMPEYYLYIENDGKVTYLMDLPENKASETIISLLNVHKILACKTSNGAGGKGFLKLELREGQYLINDKIIEGTHFSEIVQNLNGYLVMQYIEGHNMFLPLPNFTIRVNVVQYKKNEYYVFASYLLVRGDCNAGIGDFVIGFNYRNGYFFDKFIEIADDKINYCDSYRGTNYSLAGLKIPYLDEMHQLVDKTVRHLGSLTFMGLDIMITQDGVKLLEINSHPQIDTVQIIHGPLMENKIMYDFFNEHINRIKKQGAH